MTIRLPISDLGPVDFWELARLAARFLSETPLPGGPSLEFETSAPGSSGEGFGVAGAAPAAPGCGLRGSESIDGAGGPSSPTWRASSGFGSWGSGLSGKGAGFAGAAPATSGSGIEV
jgi:hypothetical protein